MAPATKNQEEPFLVLAAVTGSLATVIWRESRNQLRVLFKGFVTTLRPSQGRAATDWPKRII